MKRKPMFEIAAGLLALGVIGAGCSHNNQRSQMAEQSRPGESSMTPAAATMTPSTSTATPTTTGTSSETAPSGTATGQNQQTETLKDAQIIAVLTSASQDGIDMAKVAQKKAKNARVKKFAAKEVQQHTDQLNTQNKQIQRLSITPGESNLLKDLKANTHAMLDKFDAATGADFDAAYLDAEISAEQRLSNAIDDQMLNAAESSEVKTMLTTARQKTQDDIKEARDIQQSLSAGTTPSSTTTTKK